jgi:hypothetical protein
MPQTNITYDTGYNRKLKSLLDEMDAKHWNNGTSQYHPSMMGFKLSNFHGDYAGEPSARMMVGGGSHSDQRFVNPGNSPAYPPYMMSSGLLVNSGGALIGVDGAVGGRSYTLGDFGHDVAHVAKEVGPDVIRSMMKSGKGRKRKGGSKVGDQIASVAKTLAPFAPLLMGLGRPAPKSKADIVDALKDLGAKKSHTLKKLKEIAMSGGYSFGDFVHDVAGVGKEVAPDLIRSALASGAGRRKKGGGPDELGAMVIQKGMDALAKKLGAGTKKGMRRKTARKAYEGGINLKDVIASAVPTVSNLVKSADPALTDGVRKLVSKVSSTPAIKKALSTAKSVVGAGRGRSARTAIVKKVMKDRGVKMIEASKIVKAEGLY